jgi:Zn-dependent alcohol dehydrogenase
MKTTYRNRLPAGGSRLRARGQDVAHFNGTACFADYAVVAEEGAIPVPKDVPFDVLATLGCAVVTGVGAVTNAAHAHAEDAVLIIGAGGVGLNVAQGAALSGCSTIIAVDLRQGALSLAQQLGATHIIDASQQDVTETVKELTGGRGADYVFDTVGSPGTIGQALECSRKGGAVVVTGLSRTDAMASFPTFPFVMQEKRLIGSLYGSGQPSVDIPHLVALFQEGRLKLRELVTHRYQLSEVNDALNALAAGTDARGIIEW